MRNLVPPGKEPVNLDLTQLNGNAFALLGGFQKQARREGWTTDEIEMVRKEATSGNYDHLVATLSDHCKA